eukprot:2654627-Amphidinium_carterae.1
MLPKLSKASRATQGTNTAQIQESYKTSVNQPSSIFLRTLFKQCSNLGFWALEQAPGGADLLNLFSVRDARE